jgi:hypothetical protein
MLASVSSDQVDLERLGDLCRDYNPNVKRGEEPVAVDGQLGETARGEFNGHELPGPMRKW